MPEFEVDSGCIDSRVSCIWAPVPGSTPCARRGEAKLEGHRRRREPGVSSPEAQLNTSKSWPFSTICLVLAKAMPLGITFPSPPPTNHMKRRRLPEAVIA